MKGKILFAAGLAVGYVLGTRAGRERYEELKRAAQSFWNDPRVKNRVDQVEDFVKEKVPEVAEFVSDGAKKVVDQVTGKASKKPAAKPTTTAKPSTTTKKPATRTRTASSGSSS
jgi:hypothetical protein